MSDEIYLCLYVKEFPAQALLRLRPELCARPVVVMQGDPPLQQVCSLNKQARTLGVTLGMSRAEVNSFPSIVLLKRSLPEERSTRSALLDTAGTFSPRVEDISTGSSFCCVLDITGTEKLFGPPSALAVLVREAFKALAVSCSVAVSYNFHTAVCLARAAHKAHIFVPLNQERQALSTLSTNLLDISGEHAETFAQWGVTTLGTLAMLPERELIARLGQEGKRLRQLARGEWPHLFLPIDPVLALEERLELEMPVEIIDSLLFGVSMMLDQLIARAGARMLSLAEVTAELGLENGQVHTRTVRPALPTSDKQLWLKLLHLDWGAHPPPAAVILMTLKAQPGETSTLQLGLFSPQLPEPGRLDVTLARIRAVVGEDRVGSVELKDSHQPDAFCMKPFSARTHVVQRSQLELQPAVAMRRLRPPIRVAMTIRNNHPHIFYFGGSGYEVVKCYGPWQAAGGWWSEDRWSIEEWDIVARKRDQPTGRDHSGQLLCSITRDSFAGHWQVEALYD